MLIVNNSLQIPDKELVWRFDRSSGPGGQHVNKTSTRTTVSFVFADSQTLTAKQVEIFSKKFGNQISASADKTKSQNRNRELALEKLKQKLEQALQKPKRRKPTKPSRGSIERRIQAKKRRSQRIKDRNFRIE